MGMTEKEVLEVIEQARREGRTALSLRNCGLTSLPAEIGGLAALTKLDVSDNQLTSLPAEIGGLSGLTELNVWNNQLTSLPAEICGLSNLAQLYVNNNQLTSLPAEIGRLSSLAQLNVAYNQLTSLPAEIGGLSSLTELVVYNNQLTSLPAEIGGLSSLARLVVYGNQLTSLPAEIGRLSNLMQVSVSDNQLTSLPAEIGRLSNLTELVVYNNQLTSLSAEICGLSNLTQLYVNNNQLTELPAEIGRLSSLTELVVYNNQLTELPAEIGRLSSLTELHVNSNQLTLLPAEIGGLSGLTELIVSRNQLTSLPAEIGRLSSLAQLYVSRNKLTSLPAEIGGLSYLTQLNVSHNQLTSLPAEIGGLSNLTELHVNSNQLTSLPAEIGGLSGLTMLNVSRNELASLPAEIGGLSGLTLLYVSGNPLESPPLEVASQGVGAISNYFRELEKAEAEGVEGEVRLYEAKLLVVGRGKVGKTFLASRVIHDRVPEVSAGQEGATTEGIDIEPWYVDVPGVGEVRVNFWDFGGQEIYHATHQFFLTKRSLYLFVWEAREDDDMTGFDYWLNAIGLLSDDSPVLVVMNKSDVRSKAIDEASIGEKFGNVVGFHKVSAIEGAGCDGLRKQIIEEIGQLEHIGDRLPKVWKDVRTELESLKENYISYERYKDICAEFGLDEERAGFLSRYYQDLGVFLHFEDNPVLRDYVFLEPEWATNAVYKVLDEKEVRETHGRFGYEQLRGIWAGEYPEEVYKALLELMKKFELCFELEGRDEYIIAELLAAERPEFAWDYEKNLRFQYRYDFMPAGIITRFMSRNHDLHRGMDYWRNGVVLTWEGSEALIVSDRLARRIRVWIWGEDPKGMLAIVRREIRHIHETLNEPAVEEMLQCVCKVCRRAKEPYFHSYEVLARARRSGRKAMTCQESFADVAINDLLGEYGLDAELGEDEMRGGRYEKEARVGDTYHVQAKKVIIGDQTKMNADKIMSFGDGNTFNEAVFIADGMENCFNTVAGSDVDGEIKGVLNELLAAVTEAAKGADKATAERMVQDAEMLTKEMASGRPRRKWYELSVEGLCDAAEAVGKVGGAVVKAAAKLGPLVAGMLT